MRIFYKGCPARPNRRRNGDGNPKTELLLIFVAIVTVVSLCALCVPANAGVSPEDGRDISPGDSIIIGETNLNFFNATGGSISEGVILSNWENSNIVIPFSGSFDSSRYEEEMVPGEYLIVVIVIDTEGEINYLIESYIYFIAPKLEVTATVNEEDFDWVTRGGEISFEMDTNMWIIVGNESNYITYKLLDPSGGSEQLLDINGTPVTYFDVSEGTVIPSKFDTAGKRTGVYTLSIKADPDTNNGLDAEGEEISFEVRSKGVTIEASDEKQTVTEEIVFTIYTTPHTNVTVDVTWGRASKVQFGAGGTIASGLSDENGEFKTSAVFADTGAYEITATEGIIGTTDSIFVEIVPYEAEVKVDKEPPIYHIGENVKITGSATAGSEITLKIEDELVDPDLDVNGFDYTWQTEDKAPGSYKIAIWVEGGGSPFSDPSQDPPDASITVVLIRGGLFVEPSAPFVALGDKFTIGGIVPGRDYVDILTIAPDGGGGSGLDPGDIVEDTGDDVPGLTYETTGVDTDGNFETEGITVGADVDIGTYLIAALNYGRDGVWGKSRNDDLLNVTSNDNIAILAAKTTDQLLAMLKDKTINAAGTDDLLGIATISVEKGFVTLDELEDVPLGKKIEIAGTTNRQVDTSIIVTVEGLEETTPKLKPQIATVKEDDKTFYNTFSISFDTKSTNIGTYEVTADDGDGHTASTTVTILPAEEHSVTVSTTPTPKIEDQEPETGEEVEKPPAKTTTPTPTEEAPEETEEQPGFGMPLAIAGLLLAVVVLLRRRNKNKGDGRADLVTLTK